MRQPSTSGAIVGRGTLLLVADKFVELLSANISGRFSGWEQALENVKKGVLTAVTEARNTEPALLQDNSGN